MAIFKKKIRLCGNILSYVQLFIECFRRITNLGIVFYFILRKVAIHILCQKWFTKSLNGYHYENEKPILELYSISEARMIF